MTRFGWFWYILAISACSGSTRSLDSDLAASAPTTRALDWEVDEDLQGLRVRLSDADPATIAAGSDASAPRTEPGKATALDEDATAALVARLPEIETDPRDQQSFAMRKGSTPPPRTGEDVPVTFPPEATADQPAIDDGPVEVLRWGPEGDLPIAPHLSVTFSQPMVAVTSHAQTQKTIPLTLTPQPPGEWRWVGTRTLRFDPDPRFPMATHYEVQVDPEATSATGNALEAAKSWTFSTPAIQLVTSIPHSSAASDLDPVIGLRFDQAIDVQDMSDYVRLEGGDGPVPGLRLAKPAEIDADPVAKSFAEGIEPGRSLMLVPTKPLNPNTHYQVVVGQGAPSAEGPRRTGTDQTGHFYTYQPLEVNWTDCRWGRDGCLPEAGFTLTMNNPLDGEAFDPASVVVEPALGDMRVRAIGTNIAVTGDAEPETTYEVTLPSSLKDRFGQTLEEAQTRSFDVGHNWPQLTGPDKEIVVLDPAAPPALSVYSVNHDVLRMRVYAVDPSDFGQASKWMREARYDRFFKGNPPGQRVADTRVEVEGPLDELVETRLDLAPYLDDGKGHLFVWVEPVPQSPERWQRIDLLTWVQVTDIGLTVFADQDELLTWTTRLADGKPAPGVELSLLGMDTTVESGSDGLARVEKYPHSGEHQGPHVLVARKGNDVAFVPDRTNWWNEYGSWNTHSPTDSMRWFIFDDRKMYRPSETVHLKGWVRRLTAGPGSQLAGLGDPPTRVMYTVDDAQGVRLLEGEADVTETGGFDFELELPDTPNLGTAYVRLSTAGGELYGGTTHAFEIQEFRRPEFEVTTELDPRPYVLGERAVSTASANYYAGGSLPNAPVEWLVSWAPTPWSPPDRGDFRFGQWRPWWYFHWGGHDGNSLEGSARHGAKTDAMGTHRLQAEFVALNPPSPMAVTLEGTIYDVNRQRWSSSDTVTLHPASIAIGMRPDKGFYEEEEEVAIEVIAVDLEGESVADVQVEVELARLDWAKKDGTWKQIEIDTQRCTQTSAADAVPCTFVPNEGGTWRARGKAKDSDGRPTETTFDVYISGGSWKKAPTRTVELERVTLVPDQETYQPGDTAKILVQAPFWPAEGTLQLRDSGILETRRFTMDEATTVLEVALTTANIPNLHVEVDLVGAAQRRDDEGNPMPDKAPRVAYASGSAVLKVPPLERTLTVAATPREAVLSPGGQTILDVTVTGADGKPRAGEVAVVAVDEAVLALTGYRLPDPLAVFYADDGPGVSEYHLRYHVVLADPMQTKSEDQWLDEMEEDADMILDEVAEEEPMDEFAADAPAAALSSRMRMSAGATVKKKDGAPAPAAAPSVRAESTSSPSQTVEVRKELSAIALFAPRVRTDATGKATVELNLPDDLTRYRVMAVAVAGDLEFGSGESTVTARKPLMLRPSPPRFMNFGDRVELPLVVQNQTDEPLEVDVGLRVSNASVIDSLEGPLDPDRRTAGRRLTVAPQDRREVRIPVAADMAGTLRFQAIAVAGTDHDAVEQDLPVWTPATTEAFAVYGEIDDGAIAQPVEAPPDTWVQFGGLEVSTSSTALASLTDAMLYLVDYPYDCSEQIASRVMAVAALRDVLEAFGSTTLPDPAELDAAVERDIARLQRRQQGNGGWGYWANLPTEPYLTVHVTHGHVRAQSKGYEVDDYALDRAMNYVRNVERHIPWFYSDQARWTIIGYSVYVRHLHGDDDVAKARNLVDEAGLERLPLEAQAWILPTLDGAKDRRSAEIQRHLANRASEEAGTAQFSTGYTDDNDYVLLHSSRRTDAVVLDALTRVDRDNDLIPKVVRGLLGHRTRGRWSTTQENSLVLLAMDKYFREYESVEPDFVARMWLGEGYAGDHTFQGYTTERSLLEVPMAYLSDPGGTRDLVLAKEGPGRLYYRIGMRYAPKDLKLKPADHGFEVVRTYEAIDDPGDVRQDEDGVWHIRAGARVRVRVSMVAEARRTHVALVDPVPAGLEPVNPDLAVTGAVPKDPKQQEQPGWWWRGTWYEHQNLRDERAEAYTSLLWHGVYDYTYAAVATTPGRFVVPPAKAEEMYHPETFGRSGTDYVVVQ